MFKNFYKKTVDAIFVQLIALALAPTIALADVPRFRGVELAKASLYYPRDDNTWICLNGEKTIKFNQINDDYCDCADGSDEPGTSACPNGRFYCANKGHIAANILSSRVNDRVCDCCDGSDEYGSPDVVCRNVCQEKGRAEQEERKNTAEIHKLGSAKRADMIVKGKQMRAERDVRRDELEKRKREQESLKVEKEQLKRSAEIVESEALEFYKEQDREQDEGLKLEESPSSREEAETLFSHYDTNKDGFVEIVELQIDISLDRDRNGVVTMDEAKYILDDRERINLESFISLSWPRIKSVQMLTAVDDRFKKAEQEQTEEDERLHGSEHEDANEEFEPETDADGDGYEDEEEDADVGEGVATPEQPPITPEYDPETQRLVDLANEARHAHADVERQIREIDQEIKEIDEQSGKDYGEQEEYAALDGECHTFEDREYVYSLCPFERASQKQRSGGAETTLGHWDHWIEDNGNKYAKQKYSHGATCWNGPQRSAIIQLKCALEPRITEVTEPNRCEYHFVFETPAACDDIAYAEQYENAHDEL